MCFRLTAYLISLICLAGCGYRFGEGQLASSYQTVSVPFVVGDPEGDLTAAIVKEITCQLPFRYRKTGGQLCIEVKIVDLDDENIGFRYACKREGKRAPFIEPVESRLRMVAELSIIEASSGRALFSPVRLVATVDIDHDYNYSVWRRGATQFSLGQLSDADAAFEAARRPLNQIMAQKIAQYIQSL